MSRPLTFMMVIVIVMGIPSGVFAFGTDHALPSAQDEQRARDLFQKLRCVVCQNQSIDDSNAPLAVDLRHIVRQKITEGASNDDILEFMTTRYGDWILMEPPITPQTTLLWVMPLLLGGVGLLFVFKTLTRNKNLSDAPEPLETRDGDNQDLTALLQRADTHQNETHKPQ